MTCRHQGSLGSVEKEINEEKEGEVRLIGLREVSGMRTESF